MIYSGKKGDEKIQQDVLSELAWDNRVEPTDVGVEVDDGVVTLTGTVSSWAKRLAAEQAAHRVLGVLDVANDVRVKIPGDAGRTDTEIAQAVRSALEWDVFVPDKQIKSTVSDGVVTLNGAAKSWAERQDAERAVSNLMGVRNVVNKIEVASQTVIPHAIHAAVQAALQRHAFREASRIEFKFKDGTVSISGKVGSLSEREAVIGAAYGTRGVRFVTDHLSVEPYAP